MRRFAVDGKTRDFYRALMTGPRFGGLARYFSTADKFDPLGLALDRHHTIADPKLFNFDFALGVFIRVPGRKQLHPTAFAHTARADELRPAKPNPSAARTQFPTSDKAPPRRRQRGLSIGGSIQGASPVHL